MKRLLPLLLLAFIGSPFIAGDTPAGLCAAPFADTKLETASATPTPKPAGHPLRGVVQNIMTERSALLVKHEEIPGVMRAMTMLLNVTAADIAKPAVGDKITATLYRDADNKWWLRDITVVPTS
jgi:Cu/Ag efflux protein CusF